MENSCDNLTIAALTNLVNQVTSPSGVNRFQSACFYEENERTNRDDVIRSDEDNSPNTGSNRQSQLDDELEQPPTITRQEAPMTDQSTHDDFNEHYHSLGMR